MSSQPFDQLFKQLFEELLQPLGTVQVSREVPGESRLIDIYFSPDETPQTDPASLGLLGRMVDRPCLLEPYRNPPEIDDLETCLLKRLWVVSQMRREQQPTPTQTPRLWIITPTMSDWLRSVRGAQSPPRDRRSHCRC